MQSGPAAHPRRYHRLCADCACVANAVAVAAWSDAHSTDEGVDPDERFVTYHHNGARMGNQFMTVRSIPPPPNNQCMARTSLCVLGARAWVGGGG